MKTTFCNLTLVISLICLFSCNDNTSKSYTKRENTSINTSENLIASKVNNESVEMKQPTHKDVKKKTTQIVKINKVPQRNSNQKGDIFTINVDRDTSLICSKGTSLKIKANSFQLKKDSSAVNQHIILKVEEYYTISELLLANLTTKSDSNILETGGTIFISAESYGLECELKENSTIEIGFPYEKEKEGMTLFDGEWENGSINWSLQQNESSEAISFLAVEKFAEFKGGLEGFYGFLSNTLKYPKKSKRDLVSGTVYASFVIDKQGEVKNVAIIRGINKEIDSVVVETLKKSPKWKPAEQRGANVDVKMTFPITFSFKGMANNFSSNDFQYQTNDYIEEKIKNNDIDSVNLGQINRYLLSSTSLGWINCDRFYRDSRRKIDFALQIQDTLDTDVKIVFDNVKAIMAGYQKGSSFVFQRIPENEPITLVATKKAGNKFYLCIKNTTTQVNNSIDIKYEEVTFEQLKSKLEKLNRL